MAAPTESMTAQYLHGQVAGGPALRRKRLPAWALSAVFHLALLVLLGLVLRPSVPKGLPSTDRPGGIVLAKQTETATEYLEPESATETESGTTADSATADELPPEAVSGIDAPTPVSQLSTPGAVQVGGADATGIGRPVLGANRPSSGKGPTASLRPAPAFAGPVARISLFGSGFAEGNSFVFVIDRSKSMGAQGLGVLQQAKVELAKAMESLGPKHKFQVVAYHHERTYMDRAGLIPATEANKRRVAAFFDDLAAFGGTNHELALFAGLGMQPDVIFFLTDGGSPELTRGQLDQLCTTAKRMGTTIHCIQFGYGPAPEHSFMLEAARRTGGTYRYIQRS